MNNHDLYELSFAEKLQKIRNGGNGVAKEKKLQKAMKRARQSLELEGFTVTKEHDDLVMKRMRGEITQEQFDELVKQAVKRKGTNL